MNFDNRLTKLETTLRGNERRKVMMLVAEPGETGRDCVTRCGHDPDGDAMFIVVAGMTPSAERLGFC